MSNLISTFDFKTFDSQYIEVNFLKSDFNMNPKYGNVTNIVQNETHLGEITLFYFQKIKSFTKKILIVSESRKVIMNTTSTPCNRRNSRNMNALLDKVMGSFKSGNGGLTAPPEPVRCPCNMVRWDWILLKVFNLKFQGKTVLSPRVRTLRLPMIVPSVFMAVGNYETSISYTEISKGKSELFLTNNMTYEVVEIKE